MTNLATSTTAPQPSGSVYHRSIRILHWSMAVGFVLMWASGVAVTNVEGLPFWVEEDRQGVLRDLHKSIGLTLMALLLVRIGFRFFWKPPALPAAIGAAKRRIALVGHVAIYATVTAAVLSGLAIADVHEYGNAYFGLPLPQIFPTTETIAGFSSTPWAYVLHAVFAYGLLALVLGHVGSVAVHRVAHGVDLLPRILRVSAATSAVLLPRLSIAAILVAAFISVLAARAIVTTGPLEEPRDYVSTTPFAR